MVNNNDTAVSDKVLLKLLSKALFGKEFNITFSSDEFAALYKESCAQAVCGLAFDALPVEWKKVDAEIYSVWQKSALRLTYANLYNAAENQKLTLLLNNADIKHSTIKGIASAGYYPNPHLRTMGDIDFLVEKKDLKKAIKLLNNNGFTQTQDDDKHDFHIGFIKNKTIFELHHQITTVPKEKEYVLDFTKDIVKNAVPKNINNAAVVVPDTFCHGMIILLHMTRHVLNGEGVGLRHLCDWAVFVESMTNDEFVSLFADYLNYCGLYKFAASLSHICYLYLGMSHKEWFEPIDKALAKELMEDLLSAGNFGKKDKANRAKSAVMLNRSGKKQGYFKILFASAVRKTIIWKPFFGKHKALLPFGMLIYAVRISFQKLTGRKEFDFKKIADEGKKRNEIYNKLEFFITKDDK